MYFSLLAASYTHADTLCIIRRSINSLREIKKNVRKNNYVLSGKFKIKNIFKFKNRAINFIRLSSKCKITVALESAWNISRDTALNLDIFLVK